jgi:2-keto-3-deoxy-L-rhamnonate aldolase RhmA
MTSIRDLPINRLKAKLERGEVAIGLNVRHAKTSEIGAILLDCGYDWFLLDDEHSPVAVNEAYQMSLAAIRAGITPLVRVRSHDHWEIGRHLSNGPLGLFIPHIETAAQAEAVARASRFAPRGTQSVGGSFPQIGYRRRPAAEATALLDDLTTVAVMLESPRAVAAAEEIAAVSEVDILFIGCTDLTYEMGIPGQYGHERVTQAVAAVCAAAKRHGKHVGLGGPTDPALWQTYLELGVRMIMTENDLSLFVARASERAAFYQDLFARSRGAAASVRTPGTSA